MGRQEIEAALRAYATLETDKRALEEIGEILEGLDRLTDEQLKKAPTKPPAVMLGFLRSRLRQQVQGQGTSASGAGAISEQLQERLQQLEQLQERLQALETAGALMWQMFDYDDCNATAISVPEFKASLMAAYSKQLEGKVGRLAFCMLTHKYLPKSTVIAAHLWKRLWARFCGWIGFDHIDDVRNGLLLFKPIEWAFDNSRLSIVPDTTFNPPTFQAYLQDASLAKVRLVDKLEELRCQGQVQYEAAQLEYIRQQLQDMTFGQVHQRNLQADCGRKPNPFTRVLNFQYKCALRKAAAEGWQQLEGTPPPSHSSNGSWAVQRMFDSLSTAPSR